MVPHRIMFWQIENVWVFYLLVIIAVGIFAAGVAAHLRVWGAVRRKNSGIPAIRFSKGALKRAVLDSLLGRRVLRGETSAGMMHLLLFWGFFILFIGTALLAIHDYLFPFLTGRTYLIYSLVLEAGGIMLLAGVFWALVRRYIQRIDRLERRLEDALVPVWILLAGLSGFMVEGLRLAYQQPPWHGWSFAGAWIAPAISSTAAMTLYPYFWWGHAVFSLCFIAAVPYTKLFHILGAPVSIYAQGAAAPSVLDMDRVEAGAGEFGPVDSIFFDACMRCGRCVSACPSEGAGEPFSPREFVQAMRRLLWEAHFLLGDIRFLSRGKADQVDDKFWYCTTCRACLEVCPVYGAAFEAVLKNRISAVEEGTHIPKLMNQTLEKVFKYDNPWESSKTNRGAWAEGMELVDLSNGSDSRNLCYFVGCTTSFDDTARGIAVSFSRILQKAGVDFGILGKKEPCCGDIARRVGELGLFLEQTDKCRDLFDRYGITEVVTSSPHCFHTFRHEYPEAGFNARHYTQVLFELLTNGKLRFKNGMTAPVTFHDPCYLGRYNGIYDEPRKLIRSIPGLSLVEMNHHGADSLCCGGGGGRMWQDLEGGDPQMSEIRIREAEITGARILVTACPLCRIMLEDARKATGLNETLQVMDLNELVLQHLEEKNG